MRKIGRPSVLNDQKCSQIVAIVSVGCSQGVAAQYVGCAVSTIQRTADRNAEFAQRLDEAKSNAELVLVKRIHDASKKEQYWRAAAWALERGFPEKYAARKPDVVTPEQIGRMLSRFKAIVIEEVPMRYRKNILKRMAAVAQSLGISLEWEEADDSA